MRKRIEDVPACPEDEARQWIVQLASGDVTDEELARLQDWRRANAVNDAAFTRERQSWQDLAVIESAFRPLDHGRSSKAISRRVWPKVIGAAAAAIALILAVPQASLWYQTDHSSPKGAISRIVLPDGSIAMLDSASAIAVDFDDGQRTIRLLKGRGWFQVRHGDVRPFRVAAGAGVAEDIGTAFEVDATDPFVRVGVTEGAIRLKGVEGSAVILHSGERAAYGEGDVQRIAGNAVESASWRNGELLMRSLPLDAAIQTVARYRSAPVFIWGDVASSAPVSGSFRTDQPDDALKTLITMRNLDALYLPGGVLILRPGKK